ncbi:MAG: transglutaminase family protein, partial [Armatimonadia bacterium]|nr:transglutaminase family protein [Armatimonadia bacterium]
LCAHLHEHIDREIREEGAPLAPHECLARGAGACRDLAELLNAAARVMGIAARFVSGYRWGEGIDEAYMHAWSEVYLPGAGWRGYDPVEGLAVADRHVPVAASPHADGAAPTFGTFRRTGADATLSTDLRVEALDAD